MQREIAAMNLWCEYCKVPRWCIVHSINFLGPKHMSCEFTCTDKDCGRRQTCEYEKKEKEKEKDDK